MFLHIYFYHWGQQQSSLFHKWFQKDSHLSLAWTLSTPIASARDPSLPKVSLKMGVFILCTFSLIVLLPILFSLAVLSCSIMYFVYDACVGTCVGWWCAFYQSDSGSWTFLEVLRVFHHIFYPSFQKGIFLVSVTFVFSILRESIHVTFCVCGWENQHICAAECLIQHACNVVS